MEDEGKFALTLKESQKGDKRKQDCKPKIQTKKGKEVQNCSESSYRGSSCSETNQSGEDLDNEEKVMWLQQVILLDRKDYEKM